MAKVSFRKIKLSIPLLIVSTLLMSGEVYSGGYQDLSDELDELNAQGKGFQSLFDDLDAIDQPKKQIIVKPSASDFDNESPTIKSTNHEENTDTFGEEGEAEIKEVFSGVYSIKCGQAQSSINAGRVLSGSDSLAAAEDFQALVASTVASTCRLGNKKHNNSIIDAILNKAKYWVTEKYQKCFEKHKENPAICQPFKDRAIAVGVRG